MLRRFPSLLNQLWAKSICPDHIKTGFQTSGLFPLNPAAIPQYKIAPSIAVLSNDRSASTTVMETPLHTELRHFFAKRLQQSQDAPKAKRKRIQVHVEGEALTNDEVMDLMKKQQEEKEAKKKRTEKKGRDKGKQRQKARPRKEPQTAQLPENSDDDTSHCFKCGGVYLDTEGHEWVGCDSCYRWFHFKWTGFKRLPKEAEQFVCHICQN